MCSDQGREAGEVVRQTTSAAETGGSVSFILAGWGRDRNVKGYPVFASAYAPVGREKRCDDTVFSVAQCQRSRDSEEAALQWRKS